MTDESTWTATIIYRIIRIEAGMMEIADRFMRWQFTRFARLMGSDETF